MNITNYDVKLLSIDDYNEFKEYLNLQYTHSGCLRKDWFDPNKTYSLQNRLQNYLGWTVLCNDKKILAFAGMQHFEYMPNTVRVCTRLYYDPSIRHQYNFSNKDKITTPITPFLTFQINYLKSLNIYDNAIMTMESHRHKNIVKMIANNLNSKTGGLTNFIFQEDKIQTHKNQLVKNFQWYMKHNLRGENV